MKRNLFFAIVAVSALLNACQKNSDTAAAPAGGPAPVPMCVSSPNAPGCVNTTGSGQPTGDVFVENERALIRMMEENGPCGQRGNGVTHFFTGPKCTDYLNMGGVTMQIAPAPTGGIYNVIVSVGFQYIMVFPMNLITFNPRPGFELRMATSTVNPAQLPPGYTLQPGQQLIQPAAYPGSQTRGLAIISKTNAFPERILVVELQYRGRRLGTSTLIRL